MTTSRAQIVATLGPASSNKEVLLNMASHQMDVVRLNLSWGNTAERAQQIGLVREVASEVGKNIPIILDLPGRRVQGDGSHSYNPDIDSPLTEDDKASIKFGIEQGVEYFAISFVASKEDVEACRTIVSEHGGNQKVIAKIERQAALDNLDSIIAVSDAIMIARGDLCEEIPLEKLPEVQKNIIEKCNAAKKPVITATEMLLSMVESPTPTRAEITDVANAILEGSDAVMLSEETAIGRHPVEAVAVMERIVLEAEKNSGGNLNINTI
jgi:pyruvate kinase